jgi:hypothetical protein
MMAITFALKEGRYDLAEMGLWNAYDFISLHELYSSEKYPPSTADSFLFSCLTAVDCEDDGLFNKLVDRFHDAYPIQTQFVRFQYDVGKGNISDAKTHFALYLTHLGNWTAPSNKEVFGTLEENVFDSYRGMHWILRTAEKVGQAKETGKAVRAFWNICFGDCDNILTEWPLQYEFENKKWKRQGFWLAFESLSYVGLKVDQMVIVRMPYETCLIEDGKIIQGSDMYRGLALEECQKTISDGETLFRKGIYGKKLNAQQVAASKEYS